MVPTSTLAWNRSLEGDIFFRHRFTSDTLHLARP